MVLEYSTYSNENLSSNQGGPARISYSYGALSVGNSVLIDPVQEKHTIAEISKKLRYYRVLSGDTVSSIARKFGVTQSTVVNENNIIKGRLKINQELVILPVSGIKHKIAKGDSISKIAKKYSADVEKIINFNQILENDLKIGENIIIPGGIPEKKKIIARKVVKKSTKNIISKKTGTAGKISLVGDGSKKYINYRGIVPYGKGIKISVPKRSKGRIRYTKTNYGYFTHPAPGTVRTQSIHHRNAIDMGAPIGTKIYAAASGKVIKSYSGGWGGGYGNNILIQHPNGIVTMYAHNSKNLV